MLDMLLHTRRQRPFLVVVPMSTLHHWEREIRAWTRMHHVVYHGSKDDRWVGGDSWIAGAHPPPPRGGGGDPRSRGSTNASQLYTLEVQGSCSDGVIASALPRRVLELARHSLTPGSSVADEWPHPLHCGSARRAGADSAQ